MNTNYDAIVVGCGPVGAVAALHLANAGMQVGVVEEHVNPYPYPRAVMLDAYSCAILAEVLGDDFDSLDLIPTPFAGYFLDKNDLERPFASTNLDIGDRRNWFVQPQLESILRAKLSAHEKIEHRFGWSARKLYTDAADRNTDSNDTAAGSNNTAAGSDNTVRLTIENLDSAVTEELSGRYLLGCDGGNSFVRKQAGGRLTSLGDAVQFLVVDARVPAEHRAGSDGHAYQIVDQERPTTYLPMGVNDHVRWEFRINPGDDILELQSPSRILELLTPWAEPDHVELIRHTVYKFNSLIASQWRFGNVFVCGDAAHQTSPFLGQGLNMGIRNTRNLCQKLQLTWSGHAPPALLDRYQAECYDDTKGTIKEALRMGKLLFNTSAPANALRSLVGSARRGRAIDITAQIAPTARTLDETHDVPSSVRKVLPHVRLDLPDGSESMLMLLEPTRAKIIANGPIPAGAFEGLDELPEIIRPELYGIDAETIGTPLKMPDEGQRTELFGQTNYLVMLENSVLLGRYKLGQERELLADYARTFKLTKTS